MELSGQRHAPGHFTPGKETRNPLYRGWVGPRACLDLRKISPPPGLYLRTFQPVASRYTDCAIPASVGVVVVEAVVVVKMIMVMMMMMMIIIIIIESRDYGVIQKHLQDFLQGGAHSVRKVTIF
jgi:hypothetical protein